ncbi:MAG: DUF5615 family PIN-like protein [Rhizomicrobium sp.]
MRFFLDNCVPTAVARVLAEAGHEVILQKQAIAPDSSDSLVAIASATNDAILVSWDTDFKGIASRAGVSHKRLRKLSRIHFRCTEPQAADRLRKAMSWIEAEWAIAQKSPDKRMFLEIQGNALKSIR